MKIERFTEEDIREASHLAYPVWGEGHTANGNGVDLSADMLGVEQWEEPLFVSLTTAKDCFYIDENIDDQLRELHEFVSK